MYDEDEYSEESEPEDNFEQIVQHMVECIREVNEVIENPATNKDTSQSLQLG